ncbi:MAG: SH3 domain-containing protein [Rhizobiaceae bacterium]|nr:SH3 domain-containing protein [Rhizobiaceae bacterium]
MFRLRNAASLAAAATVAVVSASPASATSGPGCLVVVNVAYNDVLNVRARPTAQSRIVDVLKPRRHGIIHLDAPCQPKSVPWGSRWCRITHYDGDRTSSGWVKARFVRDSDCP